MARKKRRRRELKNDLDITNLVDVIFALLIIFMIATPLLEYSIDVSPPEMNADKIEDNKSETVNLLVNGQINFRGQIVSRDNLFEILKNLKKTSPKTILLLRADGDISYRKVIALMKEIKNSGFSNISLVTVAEK